jgi:protein-ribulosamine 3-kinase
MDVSATPNPGEWSLTLANMHEASRSPTGKYGFHVTTCDGRMARTVDWEDEWACFFSKVLLGVCKLEKAANGEWPKFERASQEVAQKESRNF